MKNSTLGSLTPEMGQKLRSYMDAAMRQLREIDDIKESLKDLTKALAEELNIEPKALTMAVRTAYKDDLEAKRESMDTVADILDLTGHS